MGNLGQILTGRQSCQCVEMSLSSFHKDDDSVLPLRCPDKLVLCGISEQGTVHSEMGSTRHCHENKGGKMSAEISSIYGQRRMNTHTHIFFFSLSLSLRDDYTYNHDGAHPWTATIVFHSRETDLATMLLPPIIQVCIISVRTGV